ncbi:ankyrin repeat domain-containing protein [Wolbachia endosymbiont of Tettigetta isshikii]|uniref:ankyrin repeat domain-containing protein n=1 Tax=Wolbachia endosymbiont of Tettigetta isshikii TaxID=3239093 RepID=UPI00397FFC71
MGYFILHITATSLPFDSTRYIYCPKLLHAAVEKGYLKIVEDLLKYGADVNTLHNSTSKEGFTPLHSAAKIKQEEVAKLLISYEADINAQDKTGKTPIFYAIENADLKITKLLLTNRANVKDNPELLNIAVKKECIEIVEALLQHDADINSSDKYGRTALHFTALSESEGFLDFLLMKILILILREKLLNCF